MNLYIVIIFLCVCNNFNYSNASEGCQATAQCANTENVIDVTKNNTRLISPTNFPKTCTFLFPRPSEVCQLRLDFKRFNLHQPNVEGWQTGNCITDSLSISGSVTANGLRICGNGASVANHMYLDYGSDSKTISITIRTNGSSGVNNNDYGYEIDTTQIKCESAERVPQNCLQYYKGQSGVVTSFNYPRQQLNSHDYFVCVDKSNPGDHIQWKACSGTAQNPGGVGGPIPNPDSFSIIGPGISWPPPWSLCGTDYLEFPGSDSGRYCTNPFIRSMTTIDFLMKVHFDGNEPPESSPAMLSEKTDASIPCGAGNPAVPIRVGYKPWTNFVAGDPGFPNEGMCISKPKSTTADIDNKGFCLAYSVVPSTVPIGDDPPRPDPPAENMGPGGPIGR